MYFKKLEIFGFKSFADRTVLNFEPGVTAIVGPNGCGKSNVFDSIRWVLGEQSVKQLRGGEMQDVIFNGTDTKLALGFAEVSVTFENSDRTLAVNADEVVITRRLFRSGESEYLVNKQESRLRDITEMFMGTGVGAEAYSLVQQGKVDLVVSAKADDRRMIFDEAAGITKYKAKKREAQSKLKETDDNLLRINDIVVEVKRQISSIERQAQKAQRFKEEFEKLKGLEQIFALVQIGDFKKEKDEIQAFLAEIQGKEAEVAREIEEYREIVERESLLLEDLEGKVQEAREQDLRIDGQMELSNRQIGFDEERLQNLDENERRIAGQRSALEQKCRAHQDKINELDATLASFNQNVENAISALQEKKLALTAATEAIRHCQQVMKADEERAAVLTVRQTELRHTATQVMKDTEGHLTRRRRLEVEETKTRAEKEAIDRRLAGVSQGMAEIIARREQLAGDLARERDLLARQNEELSGVVAAIDGLEKRKLFMISQKEFIEKLQVQYQDMPDPVIDGRFISSSAPVLGQSGFIGKIKEVIAVDPVRHESLKTYLSRVESGNLFEIVCETKFIELDPQALASQIEALEGELHHLYADKDSRTRAVAEQSRVIERIQADIHIEERRLSVCEAQQNDMSREAKKVAEELDLIAQESAEADQALARLHESEAGVQAELKSAEDEITAIRNGLAGHQDELALHRREREDFAVAVAQMETELHSLRERERSWRDNLDMFRSEQKNAAGEMDRLNAEVASYGDRRARLREDIDKLSGDIEALRSTKDETRQALNRYETEEQDVSQRLTSVRTQITMLEKDLADNRDLVHEKAMRVQHIDFQEQAVRERLSQKYGIDLNALLSSSAGVQLENGVAPDALAGEPLPVVDAAPQPAIDIEALKAEIQTLARKCESFGGVNLMAIEEFEELKNRFQFLTKQQADLLTGKESLEQAIRKINKTTRQLFIDTFVKVNEQFRIYFRMLFNGGEAQLVLLDPENALESGIEIVARPPGKKLQTISLLSGGEKTMTAIALIFSVFKVNPSPFCVLDEIDAALDEANVDRFASALKEFAKIAQFIVITHNKKTISNADVMYGVTMQQSGVSRVVSVKFAEKGVEAPVAAPAAAPAALPEPVTDAVMAESSEPEAAMASV